MQPRRRCTMQSARSRYTVDTLNYKGVSAIIPFGKDTVVHLHRSCFSWCMVCVSRTCGVSCVLWASGASLLRTRVHAATVVACALCTPWPRLRAQARGAQRQRVQFRDIAQSRLWNDRGSSCSVWLHFLICCFVVGLHCAWKPTVRATQR